MGRLLVDATDLETWSGTHGGVQRVVYMVTKELFLSDRPVTFIAFDAAENRFYKTNFKTIHDRVENVGKPAQSEPKLIHRTVAERVYGRIKRNRAIQVVGRPIKRALQRQETSNRPVREWVDFAKDDEVLILGMAWENLNIQRTLGEQREKVGFRLVQLVYDLIICLYPQLHHPSNYAPYTSHMKGVVADSDKLLAISESTKKDILKFAKREHLTPPKIEVIRLGDELLKRTVKKPLIAGLDKEFILCVGTVEVRKNHTLLYYAYKLAASKGIELPQLVIVGGSGWYSGDVQYLMTTDPEMQSKIKIVHGLPDDNLAWLYEHCSFTVYPSMYEGWGLPIAESLAYGKLCLSSSTSSMTEIAGKMIDYFSPFDARECMEKIAKYADDKTLLERIEKAIRSSYKTTAWHDTAVQIYDKTMREK
jgi:hypothetical protein